MKQTDRYIWGLDAESLAEKLLESYSSGKSWATSKMPSLIEGSYEKFKESLLNIVSSTKICIVDTPGLKPKGSRDIRFDSDARKSLSLDFEVMHCVQTEIECGYKLWQEVYREQSRFYAIDNIMMAPDIVAYAQEKARCMISEERIAQPKSSDSYQIESNETLVKSIREDLENEKRNQPVAKNGSLIGKRVNNGRKVTEVSENITDDKFMEIAQAASMKHFQLPIEELQVSTRSKFTAAFMVAFKEFNPNFDWFGKLAYFFRLLQEKAKETLNRGLRYIQKSVAWLSSLCSNRGTQRELKEQMQQGLITHHIYDKFRDWRDLKDRIVEFLNEALPQFAAV